MAEAQQAVYQIPIQGNLFHNAEDDHTQRGTYYTLNEELVQAKQPQLLYTHQHGEIWVGDTIHWLPTLPSDSVDLIFADPPYNIKKAEWDTFESQQAYLDWSLLWIDESIRWNKE